MTNYPASIQSIPNPTSTDLLENATPELDHDYQHSTANDTIEALEAKVGVDGSAVTTSHDYKLGEVTGSDKAVGKTATQTLTNKTLTAPQINFGSDARGDLMYRNSSGASARLAIGTSGQILQAGSSGDPEWVANPAAADASTTVKGVVEIATTAEITAGTATGGTGAILVVPASAVGTAGASKIVQFDGSGKYPAADGSLITSISGTNVSGVSRPIAVQTTDVSLSSSSTETDIIANTSVPGGSLSSGRAIRVQMFVQILEQNTSGDTTFRIYYGGSAIHSITHVGQNLTQYGLVEFTINYVGASSQYVAAHIGTGEGQSTATNSERHFASSTTSSVNSANAQNIKITVQGSAVNTPTTIKVFGAIIHLV